jgi:hypothetical protein
MARPLLKVLANYSGQRICDRYGMPNRLYLPDEARA